VQERWFALRVRPRAEKQVATRLRLHGYEEFLPVSQQRRRWSDRIVDLDFPLFPGYVFARFVAERRLPILTMPGVVEVVGPARTPEPIDETEMASLQAVVASKLPVEPWPDRFVGQKVRIIAGPLRGAEGTLVSVRQHHRLMVTVSLLQRSVSVEVAERDAWPSSPGAIHLSRFAS
jgi:transcription antitermination factor NusG